MANHQIKSKTFLATCKPCFYDVLKDFYFKENAVYSTQFMEWILSVHNKYVCTIFFTQIKRKGIKACFLLPKAGILVTPWVLLRIWLLFSESWIETNCKVSIMNRMKSWWECNGYSRISYSMSNVIASHCCPSPPKSIVMSLYCFYYLNYLYGKEVPGLLFKLKCLILTFKSMFSVLVLQTRDTGSMSVQLNKQNH